MWFVSCDPSNYRAGRVRVEESRLTYIYTDEEWA